MKTDADAVWNDQQDLQFLEQIESYPLLYDKTHVEYKATKKCIVFKNIGDKISLSGKI